MIALNVLFVIVLLLYSLGAYQAWLVYRLANAAAVKEGFVSNLHTALYFVLMWPWVTLEDIYEDWKESRKNG